MGWVTRRCWLIILSFSFSLVIFGRQIHYGDEHPTLAIGSPAPDFNLPGIDGKHYSLKDFQKAEILVVVFTCNHCPTAQAYEDRIIRIAAEYKSKSVALVAIMPNDPSSIRLNELDYTDMGDSFEEMKLRAARKHFNFPYLYDGATEEASKKFGPIATPHVFIFDRQRKLRYSGRIDDTEKPTKTPHTNDTRNALDALLAKKEPPVTSTKVFGCSIKWAEKSDWIIKAKEEWAKEPVRLDSIDATGIKELIRNNSGKLRLINVWATWCGPCVTEYPEFIKMHRMYGRRDFEFVSISADDPSQSAKVLKFLKNQQSSVTNYLFNTDDKYALIEAIDPKWQGALPYTLLVEPGGKIIFSQQGAIDPEALKTIIIDHPLLGRYYR